LRIVVFCDGVAGSKGEFGCSFGLGRGRDSVSEFGRCGVDVGPEVCWAELEAKDTGVDVDAAVGDAVGSK
jgi:hypothetical protein